MSQLPFRLAPDSSFYVDAAPHRAAIASLLDALRDGEAFIPLVGEFGVGKTTVARRLLDEVRDARHLVGELPGVRIDGDDLFDRVAEALGLGDARTPASAERLVGQLEELARSGREALLLVDDAHRLEADTLTRLRTLTAVRAEGRAALHVMLVGRFLPAGVEELRRAGEPLDIGAPVRVEALDAAGTRAYILERLVLAGWSGRPAFAPDTTAEIHACCNGNPGRINRLCGHLLLQLYMERRDDLGPHIVRAVDDLLRSELDGEPAASQLPPPEPAIRPAARASQDIAIDFDVVDRGADIIPTFTLPGPSHLPAPLRPGAVIAVQATRSRGPSRHALAQGVAAVALLVGGGWLWQTISGFATARSMQARFAAAAATAAPMPAAPTPHAQATATPAPQVAGDVVALAEQTISRAPPGAGALRAAAPVATSLAAVPVDATRLADYPRERTHAARKSHPRTQPVTTAATAPAPVALACTLESEALGLCSHAPARAPVRATLAQAVAPAPAPVRAPEPARPAPPACDANRAALALCPEGPRATP